MKFRGLQLRRHTSHNSYMPELDGMRFVAIMSVVVMHIITRLIEYSPYGETVQIIQNNPLLWQIRMFGGQGVELFFVISGFILSLPNARKIREGKFSSFSIKEFYIRRLTRLEPPYIISLLTFTILFYLSGKYSLDILLPRFFSSLFYSHYLFFDGLPLINGVYWSLEIEMVFYLISPFMCYAFFLSDRYRIGAFSLIILIFTFSNYFFDLSFFPLFEYAQYFFAGFLLSELYTRGKEIGGSRLQNAAIVIAFFTIFLLFFSVSARNGYFSIVYPFLIVGFYYIIFFFTPIKSFFSLPFISLVGGMCYSIYLIHTFIIALASQILFKFIPVDSLSGIIAIVLITLILVLVISTAFYLLFERPFMKKDWHKRILPRKRDSHVEAKTA
jgi:peptidoglycan/LPS O-acetylase OafA/YrhL